MSLKILILGGTKEAAARAKALVEEGHDVTTSLAGRTKEPEPVAGKIRIGGFGGAAGLADYMLANDFEKLLDMTHPFATQISANAIVAAQLSGVPFEAITRPRWQKQAGDNWTAVATLDEAARTLPEPSRVLLALGSQYLGAFEKRDDSHFVVRMVDEPAMPLPFTRYTLILGKPSADWRSEAELLKAHNITHIVCRNSGGTGAYAKIEAARELGISVIMVERPA